MIYCKLWKSLIAARNALLPHADHILTDVPFVKKKCISLNNSYWIYVN